MMIVFTLALFHFFSVLKHTFCLHRRTSRRKVILILNSFLIRTDKEFPRNEVILLNTDNTKLNLK